ncbi:MAG: hypothetical protein ACLQIB_58585 [Isosphaeraceae bacterium]
MLRRKNFDRAPRKTVNRRRFLLAEVLEDRTLLSSVFAYLADPVGVTTDLNGNVYISYNDSNDLSGQEQAIAEYSAGGTLINSAVMDSTGSDAYPGSLATLGSSESLPYLDVGDIMEMEPDGELFAYRPSTGGSASYSYYQGNGCNASSAYDPQTGGYVALTGVINLSNATFGGFGVDGSNVLVSGQANGWDFVMRATYSVVFPGKHVWTDTIVAAAQLEGNDDYPGGLAVNAQGTVLTTLPDTSGNETLFAFDDHGSSLFPVSPDFGLPNSPTITAGGIAVDDLGSFVLASEITSILDNEPGYAAITPDLAYYSANMSTPSSQDGSLPQPWGIATLPNEAGAVIATVPNQDEAILDFYQDPLINMGTDAPAYTPAQIRHAYGMDQISFNGLGGGAIEGNGTGQTIAILDAGYDPGFVDTSDPNYDTSDLAIFDRTFGLPDPPLFEQINNQNASEDPVTVGETALDVEWAHAIAPEANILLFDFAPSEVAATEFTSLMKEVQYITTYYPSVTVVSISYGAGELGMDQEGWNQMAVDKDFQATGVTFLVASGDQGAFGDYNIDSGSTTLTPEVPATSPDVIAVGGTTLPLDGAGDYPGTESGGEAGWSLGSDGPPGTSYYYGSSGGGISGTNNPAKSKTESEPNWQAQVVPTSVDAGVGRAVPDVAWDADPATGMDVYTGAFCSDGDFSGWAVLGGTSIAAPQWAGLIAIVDQERVQEYGAPPLTGYDETLPALYSAYSLFPSPFNDIQYGNNGYQVPSGGGYNLVTGLGSPIANLLVPDLAAYESQLVVTSAPASSVTAGQSFALTVEVQDGFGDVVTSYDGSVTVALARNPGGGTLGGTLTAMAVNGVAKFPGLMLAAAGAGYVIEATAGYLQTGTSGPFSVVAARATALVVTAQPPESVTAGTGFAFAITALDQYGNVATGFGGTVTASLTDYSGGVNVTAVDGVAAFYVDVTLAGTFTLTATSAGLTSTTTASFTVIPAGASQLIVTEQPPSTFTAGGSFGLTITALDQYGNVATSFAGNVSVALLNNPGGGRLLGTLTVAAVDGVAILTDLNLNTAGSGYTIAATSPGLASATTKAFGVQPAAPSQLAITVEPPSSATAGTAFGVTVSAEDPYGNVATSFTGWITVGLASGPGSLNGTVTIPAFDGVATFTNLFSTMSGSISLGASSNNGIESLFSLPSAPIVVSAAAPSQLVIATEPYSTAIAGQPFTFQPVIKEEDRYGNVVTSDNTDTVTAARGSLGTSILDGSNLTVTMVNGVATFSGLYYTKAESMSLSFSSSALGVGSATSTAVVVSPAPAAQLVVAQQPSATAIAGVAFAAQPVIYEEDQFGNLETGDNSSVVTAWLAGGAGPLIGETSVTLNGGVATFVNLSDDRAEIASLSFAAGALAVGPSHDIAIRPAAPHSLLIRAEPSPTAIAGVAFAAQPVVYEEDQFGNLETGDDSTVITASLQSGKGPLQGMTSATVSGGVATFTNLADDTAEAITLAFFGGGLSAGPSIGIAVTPGPTARLVIQTQPSPTTTAGVALATQPVVYEEDQFGNLETGDSSTVITASLASGKGPLRGTMSATVVDGVATFTNLADDTAESVALGFSGGGLSTGPSNSMVINPGATSSLVIQTQPSATATAGAAFATQPVIYEEDQFGNPETNDNSSVVTVSLASGKGPLQGTASATVRGGVASFLNLAADLAETIALEFETGALTTMRSSPINVVAAPASKLVIATGPPGSITAGAAFGLQVEAEDTFGNVDQTFAGPVTVALGSSPGGSTLSGTRTVTSSSGFASFSGLSLSAPGSGFTLRISSGSLLPATTSAFTVEAIPTVTAAVLLTQPLNRRGKPQGKPVFSGFTLRYSTAMNPRTPGLANNYQVYAVTTKGTLAPVAFTVTFNPANNTATLTFSGKTNPFAEGGQIKITATGSSGVSSQAGVRLSAGDTIFVIAPKAAGISPA